MFYLAESDARYGSFDFHAAHAAAPADLQLLLDNTESLPFRRRGYERDGMLKTVLERSGFLEAYQAARAGAGAKAEALAPVPAGLLSVHYRVGDYVTFAGMPSPASVAAASARSSRHRAPRARGGRGTCDGFTTRFNMVHQDFGEVGGNVLRQ